MEKNKITLILFFLLLMGSFMACEEVEEETVYDRWQERNEEYIDSLRTLTGGTIVATLEQVKEIPVGKLFAMEVSSKTTNENTYYIYCKKLTANPEGVRPIYTETVSTYYYGTNVNGDRFDGNFSGYSATDRGVLDGSKKMPTAFDAPTEFRVGGLISGWTAALQYMHTGERWMVYIPWQCAYGKDGNEAVLGYSTLVFDIILDKVIDK